MSRKDKTKKKREQQAQYELEKANVENARKNRTLLKNHLRTLGCDLPFYEYLDSFSEELTRTVMAARLEFSTLVAVHEVYEDEFRNIDWKKYDVDPATQLTFELDDRFAGYSKPPQAPTDLEGFASFFENADGTFSSYIVIQRNPKCAYHHIEHKSQFKLASLLHELGHIHDAERSINIEPLARRFNVIEGESYANCYALEQLADRHMATMCNALYNALETMSKADGYESEIGKRVLQRHERRSIICWNDYVPRPAEGNS